MSLSKPLFFHLKSLTPLRRSPPLFRYPEEAGAAASASSASRHPPSPFRRSQPPNNASPATPPPTPMPPRYPIPPPPSPASASTSTIASSLSSVKTTSMRPPSSSGTPSTPTVAPPSSPATPSSTPSFASAATATSYPFTASSPRLALPPPSSPTTSSSRPTATSVSPRSPSSTTAYYRLLTKDDAPSSPSPTTYSILAKGLIDTGNLEQAFDLKIEILTPNPFVYDAIMSGFVKSDDPDRVYEELKEKLGGGTIDNGAVYGNLMKIYFLKGMDKEAVDVYNSVMEEGSIVCFTAVCYNSVLETLTKHGKLDEAVGLFDRLKHEPPRRGYCAAGRFEDVIAVFRRMSEKKCKPDVI